MEYIYLFGGLACLLLGGKYLVKGGVELASKLKVSTLVIGVTVIAFGTSAPELLVSVSAAFKGHPEIAAGNVIGSNIANIALVLGITALIYPMPVKGNTIRFDWPVMMAASGIFFLFILDSRLQRWESVLLFAGLIAFLFFSVTKSRKEFEQLEEEPQGMPIWKSLLYILGASAGLALGSELLVDGASQIARSMGISERVISVSLIAFGTSVPELSTSVVAAYKKEIDISVGNILGSNIFNIMAVLGLTGSIVPIPITFDVFKFDLYWMLGIAVLLLLLIFPFRTYFKVRKVESGKLHRLSGLLLFLTYVSYLFFLFK